MLHGVLHLQVWVDDIASLIQDADLTRRGPLRSQPSRTRDRAGRPRGPDPVTSIADLDAPVPRPGERGVDMDQPARLTTTCCRRPTRGSLRRPFRWAAGGDRDLDSGDRLLDERSTVCHAARAVARPCSAGRRDPADPLRVLRPDTAGIPGPTLPSSSRRAGLRLHRPRCRP